jgi:hypothetical protein
MGNSEKIIWTTERRKLADLIPWSRNPRQIKREQARRLQESHAEFGQVETFAIGPGNEVYNGHQRLAAWAEEYGPDLEVDVRVSSRPLTEKEREKLTIYLHKGAVGEWNFDALSEWDVPDLLEWGFEEHELGLGFDELPTLDELEKEYGEPGERDFWPVVKIQVPPETYNRYKALMAMLPGADEAEKFDALISRAELS